MIALDTIGLVGTHPAARRAWRWLPACVRPGRVFVGPCGEVLIARADGGLDRVVQGGQPHDGIGADPAPGRRP